MTRAKLANQIIPLILNQNKQALWELEQAAIKQYATLPVKDSNQLLIAQAWLTAVVDELFKYNLGVYELTPIEQAERNHMMSLPGAPRILAFRKP